MKPILFALLALIFMCGGCTKEVSREDKTNDNYFVQFKLDGQTKEYLQNVSALRVNDAGLETLTVFGLSDLTANPPGIYLQIAQADPIVAQTYPEIMGSDSPAILYRDAGGVEFTNLFMTTESGLEITITEINAESVRGTFKGSVADLNGTVREVRDGAFYAKVQ